MHIKIHIPNLSPEIREQIKHRELPVQEIAAIHQSILEDYQKYAPIKKMLPWLLIVLQLLFFLPFVVFIREWNVVIFVMLAVGCLPLIVGLWLLNHLIFNRVAHQFVRVLEEGYPEYVDTYGKESFR
ncbi:MAG: hypothetical protein Q4B80_04720 [Aerococcaceae bacterium]|nr:hypothetical protein [Aerococcaceae bacterium]